MFNDRDLAVLGLSAVSAVFCLLLPFSLTGKFIAGASVLISGITLTFARFGQDRLAFEEWLKRRIRYAIRPRRWTFYANPRRNKGIRAPRTSEQPDSEHDSQRSVQAIASKKILLSNAQTGSHRERKVAAVLLFVIGVYFLYALWYGAAADISAFIERTVP